MRFVYSLALILLCTTLRAAEPPSYRQGVKPLLTDYCFRCHKAKKAEGGVDLSSFADDAAALARRKLWKRALRRVAAGEMPPEDAKQPTAADREKLTRWLAVAAEYLDC